MTTIKLKNGSGAPAASDLVQGEPALDLTNKRLYTEDSGGTVIEVGTNPTSLTTGTFTSTGIDDNATSTAITIDSSENVGIGTASPSTILDIREDSTGASTQVRVYNTDNSNTTTQTASLFLSPDSRGNGALIFAEKENADFSTSASRDVSLVFSPVLNNSQTERMRIDSSGALILNQSAGSSDNTILRITGGTAGYSTLQFADSDDLNIGMLQYNHSTNALAFNVNDSERMRVDSSGNLLVGTTDGAFVNGGGVKIANTQAARLKLCDSDTAGTGVSDGFEITQAGTQAYIFQNENDFMAFGTNAAERMRIDSSGRLLVGKTAVSNSTAGYFFEPGSGGYASFVNTASSASNRCLLLNRHGASNGRIIEFRSANSTCGHIAVRGSTTASFVGYPNSGNGAGIGGSSNMMIPTNEDGTAQDNRIQLGSTSTRWTDLYLSGGAYLGGTGSANHLDDYEEGTWSPSIASGSATFNDATYTKVGRLVTLSCLMISISDLSSSTALQINGLPFTTNSSTIAVSVGLSRYFNRGNGTIVAYSGGNSNVVNFYALSAGADYLPVRHQDLNNANVNYYLNLTYQTT